MMTNIKNRIPWIDWAKIFGIMIVVFCHVPQYQTIEKTFLCYMQMPLFFFLSGYLHKIPNTFIESLKKYWRTLVIPYIIFQFIFYPYWLMKSFLEGMDITDWVNSFFVPFAKCIWGIPIDGVTWFIFALLLMKLYIDLISKSNFYNILCGISIILSLIISYIIWSDNIVNISFAIDSLFNFFPFFMLGFFCKKFSAGVCSRKYGFQFHAIIAFVTLLVLNSSE